MHLHTERFLNAYQAELQDAIEACQAVFKVQDENDINVNDCVAATLLALGISYWADRGKSPCRDFSEFVFDTYKYVSKKIYDIYNHDSAEKQQRLEDVKALLQEMHGKDFFTMKGKAGENAIQMLSICQAYDDTMNTDTRRGLAEALTHFIYLLASLDNRVIAGNDDVYLSYKEVLARTLIGKAGSGRGQAQENVAQAEATEMHAESLSFANPLHDIPALFGLETIKERVSGFVQLLRI